MTDTSAALKHFKAFMKKMALWENESNRLVERVESGYLEFDDVEAEQMKKLRAIQEELCVNSRWRRSSFTVEWPAEYDVRTNTITSCVAADASKVTIELQQLVGAETLIQLEMLLVDGTWKVSRRWMLFKGKRPLACEL